MPNLSFTLDSVLTTKPTPMIYSDNHLRDISPIIGTVLLLAPFEI